MLGKVLLHQTFLLVVNEWTWRLIALASIFACFFRGGSERLRAGLREISASQLAERSSKYLRLMNLEKFSDRLAGKLSGGMKQKLALCCALISQPQVLLLDEPTTGVDPVSRREFWSVLASL